MTHTALLIIHLLWLLLVAHLICDYKLQGDHLSQAKNPFNPVPGIRWYVAMLAHGLMHGGFVLLVTGSVVLAVIEMASHMTIDYVKCSGRISFSVDQALHIIFKIFYAMLAVTYFGWKGFWL